MIIPAIYKGIDIAKAIEMEKKVYEDYPVTKKEKRGCVSEKAKMDEKRMERRKRYIKQLREKVEVKEFLSSLEYE